MTSNDQAAQRHPDLEGYVSKRAQRKRRTAFLPRWVPTTREDWTRFRINTRLQFHFSGVAKLQMWGGALATGIGSYLFVCWLDNVSPYLALSEDPNTAFKHPYWVEKANERVQRERNIKKSLASSAHAGGGESTFSALDHATRSYSSQTASDRLSA
jgi:hypothetical protein